GDPGRRSFELLCESSELRDHQVQSQAILPAAAYLLAATEAAAVTAGGHRFELSDVEIHRPLSLPLDAQQEASVCIVSGSEDPTLFGVACGPGDQAEGDRPRYAGGRIVDSAGGAGNLDVGELRRRVKREVPPEDHYAALAELGLEYGGAFRRLERIAAGEREALGDLTARSSGLDVPLLDGALQLIAHALPPEMTADGEAGPFVPVAVQRFWLDPGHRLEPGERLVARAVLRSNPRVNPASALADVALLDSRGKVLCEIGGVRLRRRETGSASRGVLEGHLYELRWLEGAAVDDVGRGAAAGSWLLVGPDGDLRRSVGEALTRFGGRVRELCYPSEAGRATDEPLRGIVIAAEGDGPHVQRSIAEFRGLVGTRNGDGAPIHLVTTGAQAVSESQPISPQGAALWGLNRALTRELGLRHCKRIDVDPGRPGAYGEAVALDLLSGDGEEVALRADRRLVARLVSHTPAVASVAGNGGGGGFRRLISAKPGLLDQLELSAVGPRDLDDDEIEISVDAAGLNFSDVLKALDVYPEPRRDLGLECAGTVTRVGARVRHIEPGDEVVALAEHSFAGRTVAPAALVFHRPPSLDPAQAAALPVAIATARYSLLHLARLAAGERVLVHSAAGGVGLAAIELCKRLGAEVYATSSNPEKRERLLERGGVKAVFDPDSADLADQVLAATGGEGIDVALNSLTGPVVDQTLATLAPYGRFVELGKTEIYGDGALPLGRFRENASFFAVDVSRLTESRSELLGALLREGLRELERGETAALPVREFVLAEAEDAFSHMARRRHFGKIVLTTEAEVPESQTPAHNGGFRLDDDA
ncbi:MAG TPA: polyketide synthase dehydratase domain-containing protein, partial [Solirubrobacterales bacterium]|nr:polyketide synthase dehydratase domain-containing protein [Solirubrobacterales bacterium]